MIARATLFEDPGGDTTQINETANALRGMGLAVDIHLSDSQIDYDSYSLLHFFNIIRPADVLRHIRRSRVPYVISTIYVEYGQEDPPGSLRYRLRNTLGPDGLEYLKVLARALKNGERIGSWKYVLTGHRQGIRGVARGAAMLLPNSESEYRRFETNYGVSRPYRVIPNGIDISQAGRSYPQLPQYENAVISVGRIEPRKNQLRLIQALKGSGLTLFLHGKPAANQLGYYQECIDAAGPDCVIGPFLKGADLYQVYASAKVHALPSYFETTGLVSLEAAIMGCNIVVTRGGDQPDYFGDHAWYCEPEDVDSIRQAVLDAWNAAPDTAFRDEIINRYTWRHAAEATLAAYEQVLTAPGAGAADFTDRKQ